MVLLICSAIFRFYSDLTILQHGRIFFKEILKFLKFLTTFFRSGGSNYVSHVRTEDLTMSVTSGQVTSDF